ncbi:MAG: hypothetical protein IGS39_10215 [Calothrix sp. C42_A2020_038]|nr:hypothetical protein [Calothrix sp. C42_A2020_038]
MKLQNIFATVALTGLITVSGASLVTFTQSYSNQAVAKQIQVMSKQDNKDATGLTTSQKIASLTKNKGQFGSGDELRRYFFGDLEPISVQPGGAGMVVNLYNKASDTTFAYCATFDVVVAIKQGRVKAFAPSEVK